MSMPRFRIDTAASPPVTTGWTSIDLGSPTDPTKDARHSAETAIAEVIQCEHLIVVTGLGTSLCVKNPVDTSKTLFPTMGGLWSAVEQKVGSATFAAVQKSVGMKDDSNIETLLSLCQMKLMLEPPPPPAGGSGIAAPQTGSALDIAGFVSVAELVIRTACGQALPSNSTEHHEGFLRRLVRRAPRRPRANLFTTNYDLCFETAAARIGLPVVDGFAYSVPPVFQPEVFDYDIVTNSSYSKEPDFVPRLMRLYKLHGSVDWHADSGFIVRKAGTDKPVLIYPQSGKYASSYSPPFLEIMSRFQGLLRQRNVGVLAVCCGFNDLHIAEPVLSAVKSNASLRMVVCAPDLCPADAAKMYGATDSRRHGAVAANQTIRQFDHLIENRDSRLTLINGFFPDLVALMPMLAVQTEAEQHESRIKKLEAEMAALKSGTGMGA